MAADAERVTGHGPWVVPRYDISGACRDGDIHPAVVILGGSRQVLTCPLRLGPGGRWSGGTSRDIKRLSPLPTRSYFIDIFARMSSASVLVISMRLMDLLMSMALFLNPGKSYREATT